jgi:hypothetical protein
MSSQKARAILLWFSARYGDNSPGIVVATVHKAEFSLPVT